MKSEWQATNSENEKLSRQDIAMLEMTEELFNASIIKYKTLFEIFPIGIAVVDNKGRIIENNSFGEKILGVSLGDFYTAIEGQKWKVITEDGMPLSRDKYASVVALRENRIVHDMVVGIVRSPDDILWLNVNAAPLSYGIYGAIMTFNDITDFKMAIKNLKNNEKKIQSIIENINGYTYSIKIEKDQDKKLYIILHNSLQTENITGYNQEDFITDPDLWIKMIHEDDRGLVQKYISDTVDGKSLKPLEHRIRHKNGTIRYLMNFNTAEIDENSQTVHCDGLIIDITERMAMINRIIEGEKRLQIVMDNTTDFIAYIDNQFRFQYLSNSHKSLLGYKISELKEKSTLDLVHPDEHKTVADALDTIMKGGTVEKMKMRLIAADGSCIWVESTLKTLKDKDGTVTGGVITSRDISDQMRYESNLEEAKNAAEEANRAKSDFLAMMSHELRTPLNAVIGFSEVLKNESYGHLNDKQMQYLEYINESGQHLLFMINDLLDLSKIESKKFEIRKKPFDLKKMLTGLSEMIKPFLKKKYISFKITVDSSIGILNADEVRVRQVVLNLLSNAVKFTDPGKNIGLEAYGDGERAVIIVWDEGIGISKKDHERIFQPFEQVYNEKISFKGTGLGLSLSKHLVEFHDGSMGLMSEPGRGSRFTVTLPGRSPMTDNFMKTMTEGISDKDYSEYGYTGVVLVVEDNPINQELMKAIFDSINLEMRIVSTGEEAVEIAGSERFNLILMDIDLPDIDGIETMKRIRLLGLESTPVVALTAYSMSGDEERFRSEGMDDVITKPVDLDSLIRIFNKYLPHRNTEIESRINTETGTTVRYDPASVAGSLGIPEERFRKIINTFFSDKMDVYLSDIGKAILDSDYKLIRSSSHKLRGAVSNLRFDICADLLKRIEESAEKESDTDYQDLLNKIRNELDRLQAELNTTD